MMGGIFSNVCQEFVSNLSIMIPRHTPLLFLLGALPAALAPGQDTLSPGMRSSIVATMPAYAPADPAAPSDVEVETVVTREPQPINDQPIVHLPDFSVGAYRRIPGRDPDLWLSQKGRTNTALRDYAAGMTALEWALNSWHIPLVTPSAQSRANEEYLNKRIKLERTRLTDIAVAYKSIDASDGARLLRDMDLTRLSSR